MLEIDRIVTFYGRIQVLWEVSLSIKKAEIVALIGGNGAGKSTLLNTISGIISPASGNITYQGKRINGIPPYQIVELGISHVPEEGKPFLDMSVRENLEMGAYSKRAWTEKSATLREVFQTFPRLKEREHQTARTLSGGEKQMLAMGRGLMSRPDLCLLDEPSYGLAPIIVMEVFRIIKTLQEKGITVLLVEQNVNRTLEIADRAYIMENGRITMDGTGRELMQSNVVKQAYLGM
ncbi:MAG: ABC transporter ATP-binding protein [Dehalococcoidales bacterium]|nr:ABC transporter ATP-binding protein [Dehalococcoidales bacterium]